VSHEPLPIRLFVSRTKSLVQVGMYQLCTFFDTQYRCLEVHLAHLVGVIYLSDSREARLVRSVSNTRIFVDLYLPHLTHLHHARAFLCALCRHVNVSLRSFVKEFRDSRNGFSLVMSPVRFHCQLYVVNQPAVLLSKIVMSTSGTMSSRLCLRLGALFSPISKAMRNSVFDT